MMNDAKIIWPDNMVKWRSRRGILELDYLLLPFFSQCYGEISNDQKLIHQWLLSQTDTDLQNWLVRRQSMDCLSIEQRAWIDYVLTHAQMIHSTMSIHSK